MAQSNNQDTKKRVAILIENGVEDDEFQVPYKGLQMAGIEVVVLGSRTNENYAGKQGKVAMKADGTTTEAIASDFDAVIIPGGYAPDMMRTNPNTVRFVQEAMEQGKIVAAVCHGPQVLIEGDLLRGKQATGFISIRKDIINAGANYIDEPLVVDGNLITSRQPGDLAIFTTAILSRLGYGGKEVEMPHESDVSAEWWKLANTWGGSTKGDIVKGLNTALAGERYSREAFTSYAEKTTDAELKSFLQDMITNKEQHILKLESRLNSLGEQPSIPAQNADKYAKLKNSLQGTDETFLMRSTLGDLQTGIVDVNNLRNKFTDPVATAIFSEIEIDLCKYEQCLAHLYKARLGAKPAKPTSAPAVKM
ncbi:DJ-1/PfpI/YhbO family deglycase/protease [Microcoleus sp. FACHB-831]|uniref:DJ-1/PfpI/YhbO family deglycase/protease n=1 Tax=Microcoleus sp. FACHB-831 TaxID=2692827 RepID=UPI001686D628|nr:DJ-1/PfpI/YhbO family deglycase/protease [Microcoleus sp. FACHB-831]MBD1921075.1 DJ-1/PfpI/YhbO family deglycase/protease [Microcoleus sp. FACHB-831]